MGQQKQYLFGLPLGNDRGIFKLDILNIMRKKTTNEIHYNMQSLSIYVVVDAQGVTSSHR